MISIYPRLSLLPFMPAIFISLLAIYSLPTFCFNCTCLFFTEFPFYNFRLCLSFYGISFSYHFTTNCSGKRSEFAFISYFKSTMWSHRIFIENLFQLFCIFATIGCNKFASKWYPWICIVNVFVSVIMCCLKVCIINRISIWMSVTMWYR